MRVALITDGIFPYVIGGMQRHSYYVAKYLSKNKIEVDLYHTSQNDTYDIEKLEFFAEEEKSIFTPFSIGIQKIKGVVSIVRYKFITLDTRLLSSISILLTELH